MASIALLIWPLCALAIFAALPRTQALLVAVVVPYLFLPEAFAIPLPGLPDLDKQTIIAFSLVLALILMPGRFRGASAMGADGTPGAVTRPGLNLLILCGIVVVLLSPIPTALTNAEPLVYGATRLPGMRLWDAVNLVSGLAAALIPFLFARHYLSTPDSHLMLLKVVVIMALLYSVLMLVELRLSPQLHNWVYGFHQHSFNQHVRGGYRPKVFLFHGITLGFFLFTAVIAAVALWRSGQGPRWGAAALWLGLILLVSRNLGAVMIAMALLGLMLGTPQRIRMLGVAIIAGGVLIYPALRQSGFAPVDTVVAISAMVSEERAQSLQFRLDNEDILLQKALEKPVFGWGGWGRNRVFNEVGRDISITDGLWIQVLGALGWVQYIAFFGLLAAPALALVIGAGGRAPPPQTMALAIILAGNMVYIIPNSTLTPVCWMIYGGLAGYLLRARAGAETPDEPSPDAERPEEPASARTSYSRFRPGHSRAGS